MTKTPPVPYEIVVERALEALGEEFDPKPISELARAIFPDDGAWLTADTARQHELHYHAGQGLATLAFADKAQKVGSRLWSRKTSWEDWRDWLCVVMDGMADKRQGYAELTATSLQHWAKHVGRYGGSTVEDFEPVAVQAIGLLCNVEALHEQLWALNVVRRSVAVVWRLRTAHEVLPIVEQAYAGVSDEKLRAPLGRFVEELKSSRFVSGPGV